MSDELATIHPARMNTVPNYDEAINSLQARRDLVLQVMDRVLKPTVHYGLIPGCGNKPSLFLPGAEQLAATFGFCPRYKVEKTREGQHLTVDVTCELYLPDATFVAEGKGMCSTYEAKYRYRAGAGESTGVQVPKKYWDLKKAGDPKAAQEMLGGPGFTTAKVNEKGEKDPTGTWMIVKVVEKSDNPDLADQWNTVVKMGCKRALVHAVRTATGTADLFTQDIEDFRESYGVVIDAEVVPPPAPTPPAPPAPPANSAAPPPPPPSEPAPERGWTLALQEAFVDRLNDLYLVFKEAAPPDRFNDLYNDEAETWQAKRKVDQAPEVVHGMEMRLNQLKAAAAKAKKPVPPPVPKDMVLEPEPPEPPPPPEQDAYDATPAPLAQVLADLEAKAKAAFLAVCARFENEFARNGVANPKAQVVGMRDRVLLNLKRGLPKEQADPYLEPFVRAYQAAPTEPDRKMILAQAMESKADQLKVPKGA